MAKFDLTHSNYKWIAFELGCEPEMVMSFNWTECKREPFDKDGFPAILYERHVFYRNLPLSLAKTYASKYPDICSPKGYGRGGYGTYAIQRIKFSKAFYLNKDAAMEACSWGPFQELGENWEQYNFKNVGEFVDTMKDGLYGPCLIFIKSIRARGLVQAMRTRQYAKLARSYNGKAYATFGYHTQLEANYKKAKAQKINWDSINPEAPKRKGDNAIWIGDFVEPSAIEENLEIVDTVDEHTLEDTYLDSNELQEESPVTSELVVEAIPGQIIEAKTEFIPEDKVVDTPPKEGMKDKINKLLLWLGLPPLGFGILGTAKELVTSGQTNLSSVFQITLQVFYFVFPWICAVILAYVLYRIVDKIFKQVSYLLRLYLTANPNYHNVDKLPEYVEEEKYKDSYLSKIF